MSIKCCFTSTETLNTFRDWELMTAISTFRTTRLIGDGCMEAEGGDSNRYTITTRMTPALRWTAIRATLMSH